ncbi:hypothetical protein MTF65_01845 [Streptomyces sp. APSN-46.1]|uniref:hypothetical protein n=1 Tax=Streptomyces sp. APSN-46.1 TaxID=2929049 RepID=UPI001FB309B1|nr:hypothetical protein [Streptomyces sp. APSN-46.1]MCJ1676125.1 hypothetical protein [Streptomyces sp. APSN-46.1]
MTAKCYNRFTYLAIGDAPTSLYTFDVLAGDVAKTEVAPYNDGYDALAYSWSKGLFYAMSRKDSNTLPVVDPVNKTVTPQKVAGLPENNWVLGAVSPDGGKMVMCGLPHSRSAVLDLTANPITATLQNPPGTGGLVRLGLPPRRRRLYAVDGKNGALLLADPTKNPQKVELKEKVFPKAQAGRLLRAYEGIEVDQKLRQANPWEESIDRKTEAAKVTKSTQDHRFILDTPGDDHLIEAGKSLDVDLRLYVPKEMPLEKPYQPGNLAARRLA